MNGLVPLALLACACGVEAGCGPPSGLVSRVIDGDTVELEGGTRVRLLSVNAPELHGTPECYGPQAAARTTELVEGRRVTLRYDEPRCVDRYGRTLAWVEVDGLDVDLALVAEGLACAYTPSATGSGRAAQFSAAEAQARAEHHGMWGACQAVGCAR